MDFLKVIKVPSLLDASYGDNLEEQFNNINSNFNTLANGSFVKGDDAPDIKTYNIKLKESIESDSTWGKIFEKIRQDIYNTLNTKFENADQFENLEFSNLEIYYKELEIPADLTSDVIISDDFIEQIILGISTLYIYDKYYYDQKIYSNNLQNFTGLYQITPTKTGSEYIYNISDINNFPKLILDEDNQWKWKIKDKYINASGVKGDHGTNAVTYMVVASNISAGGATIISINNIKLSDIKIEDYDKYDGQVCFVVSESNSQDSILIATITKKTVETKDEQTNKITINYQLTLDNIVSINSTFTVNNFISCMIDKTLPGLFIPTSYDNSTTDNNKIYGYILKTSENILNILYGSISRKGDGWVFEKDEDTCGAININSNVNINQKTSLNTLEVNDSTELNTLNVTNSTELNTLNVTNSTELNKLTARTLNVTSNTNLNNLYVDGEIIFKSSDESFNIQRYTQIQKSLSVGDVIYTPKISSYNSPIDILKPLRINNRTLYENTIEIGYVLAENIYYGTNPGKPVTNIYWKYEFVEKNGWVSLKIIASQDKSGTVASSKYWMIEGMKNSQNNLVSNIGLGKIIVPDSKFLPYETSGILGTYNDYMPCFVNTNSGIMYELDATTTGVEIKVKHAGWHHNNNWSISDSDNNAYQNFAYTPYMEFIYPSK